MKPALLIASAAQRGVSEQQRCAKLERRLASVGDMRISQPAPSAFLRLYSAWLVGPLCVYAEAVQAMGRGGWMDGVWTHMSAVQGALIGAALASLLTLLFGAWHRRQQRLRGAQTNAWQAAWQQHPQALLLQDDQGRIEQANRRAVAVLGLPVEQLKGDRGVQASRDLIELLPHALNGETPHIEWQICDRERRQSWVELRLCAFRTEHSCHIQAELVDLSARKLQEQRRDAQELRWRSLIDSIQHLSVYAVDEKRNVMFWNQAAEQLYGYRKDEALGKPLAELLGGHSLIESINAELNSLFAGESDNALVEECERYARHGRRRLVQSQRWRAPGSDLAASWLFFVERDLAEVDKRVSQMRHEEAAMHLAAESALGLLREDSAREAASQMFSRFGSALAVNEFWLARFIGDDDGVSMICQTELSWPQTSSARPQRLVVDAHLPHWHASLLADKSLAGDVATLPAPERSLFDEHRQGQLCIVPIRFGSRCWGFLAALHTDAEAHWSTVEQRVLKLLGSSMATALEREWADQLLRLNARVFDATHDAVMITDLNGRLTAVNNAFCEITGYGRIDVLGRSPKIIASGRHGEDFFKQMWRQLREQGHWKGEIWNRRKSGEVFPQWLDLSVVCDDQGEPNHYVAVATDISLLKRSEAELEHLAHHDTLTGLPNRLLASTRLEHAIDAADRKRTQVAVLFIDLDGFKPINDSLGHASGDALLRKVAERLKSKVRASDTLARLGGDEFLVIAEDLHIRHDLEQVASKLRKALELPFYIDNHEIFVGASIGISQYPGNGNDADELMRHADVAMYQAKASGRNQTCSFSAEMNEDAVKQLEMDASVRNALQLGRFELHYQPKLELESGKIRGFEALIRMRASDGSLVPPDRFISMAERNGTIVRIGAWALLEACREAHRWQTLGHAKVSVAVNVSARQFRVNEFFDDVQQALEISGLDPTLLELELTESLLMENPDLMVERIKRLKQLGLSIALDDFGTGFSSLGYLLRFPIDTLKIDKTFVNDLELDPHAAKIIISILDLAKRMKLKVVAEGVERESQADFLRKKRCDLIQGYLISKPVAAEEVDQLLARRNWTTAANEANPQIRIQGL